MVATPAPKAANELGRSLLYSTFLLVALGLLALYAASAMKSAELYGNPYYYLQKQVLALSLGVVVVVFFKWVPFGFIDKLTLPLLALSLLCLGAIFIPGAYKSVGGAARWFKLGFVSIQPGELAKLALVFFLAKNLSRPHFQADSLWRGLVPNLSLLAVFAGLLMLQPDFGTTVLLVMVTFALLYVGGVPVRFLGAIVAVCGVAAAFAVISAPYRWKRLTSFIDPWGDFKNGGFQIIQSYLGFQNGGLLGAGLGESRQKLYFLPEAHTDFIFAVIGEEMGLVGTLLVCLLYINIVRLGLRTSFSYYDPFKKLLAFGLTSLIALQASFNLGVVMGLFPTKGIPLPFVSSGLSSLLVFFTVIAILARLAQEVPLHEQRDFSS